MTIEEITLELELIGLTREQISKIISSIKAGGFDPKAVDKKLIQMGFEPVFIIYEENE